MRLRVTMRCTAAATSAAHSRTTSRPAGETNALQGAQNGTGPRHACAHASLALLAAPPDPFMRGHTLCMASVNPCKGTARAAAGARWWEQRAAGGPERHWAGACAHPRLCRAASGSS